MVRDGLARQVRGKVLSYREQDFVMAARAAGAGHWHITTRHLLPGYYSHIIVISTLAIPGMILRETALRDAADPYSHGSSSWRREG